MTYRRRKSNARKFTRSAAGLWVLIALVVVMCAWVYSSRQKQARQQQQKELQILTGVKGADGYTLIRTGLPEGTPEQLKDYEGFTVSFNADNHTANYVGWELLASETEGDAPRSDNFWYDADISGCPDIPDYKGSGYDRGHLYPAADAKWSAQSMSDCFSFANMTPQAHALNNGAWKTLEEKERKWAKRDGRLIIVAGPVYSSADNKRIGKTGVRVPSGFFKVLLAPDVESPRAIAFVYPNDIAPGNMQNYSMTVDEAEVLTGYDFFAALPDSIEDLIESRASFKEWNSQ